MMSPNTADPQSALNPAAEHAVEHAVYRAVDLMNAREVQAFQVPPATLIGAGAIIQLPEAAKARGLRRLFIAVDSFLHQQGLAESLRRSLELHGIEAVWYLYAGGEPDSERVEDACSQLIAARCDAVVGLGGGSTLDTAKAIALLAQNPELRLDKLPASTQTLIVRMPLFMVPTTAGTGSEATNISVVTDCGSGVKQVIAHPQLIPDVAILDARLTLNAPASLTAATGIDALTHAIEAYVARGANALTQTLACRAIRLISRALPIAVGQGSNLAAREEMMLGSYLAGMAFSNAGLGLVHAMAHALGARFHVPHGVANALLLPSVMQFNRLVCERAYGEIAQAFDAPDHNAEGLIRAVSQLIADIGLPTSLRAIEVDPSHFPELASTALRDACLPGNPRSCNRAQIEGVFLHALQR